MSESPRTELWLVRHGATEWSESGRHTSITDLPLLPSGAAGARRLGERLNARDFGLVLSSPRRRARATATLAGFPDAIIDEDLVEWGYGPGEGLTSIQIREIIPGWRLWTHGAPDFERDGTPPGETEAAVRARLSRVVRRVRESGVDRAIAFSHGHALRALAMVWLDQPIPEARQFPLDTGTLSVLGYEKENAAIVRWNAEV